LADVETLASLPDDQFRSGMGEVVKYAIAMDEILMSLLEKEDSMKNLEEIVTRCMELKMNLVEKDAQDTTGIRAILNFGHTLGQAIELQTNLLHGDAISIGMAFAIEVSKQQGMLTESDAVRAIALLDQYKLPTSLSGIDHKKAIEQMKKDKKSVAGSIKLVLLEGLGKAKSNREISESAMEAALKKVLV
jgi:3-dehydroquinate synthase